MIFTSRSKNNLSPFNRSQFSLEQSRNFFCYLISKKKYGSTNAFYFRSRSVFWKGLYEVEQGRAKKINNFEQGSIVVFVREIDPDDYAWCVENGLIAIYFMDDDLADLHNDDLLPAEYRARRKKQFEQTKKFLPACHTWVSSEHLAKKYQLPIENIVCALEPEKSSLVIQYAYHGSSNHVQEHKFFLQLVDKIQSRYDNTVCEVFGDFEMLKKYRHIPRVRMIHPMSWDSYFSHTQASSIDIVLVPLFESVFNEARTYTKVLDAKRMNAIVLASHRVSCPDHLINGVTVIESDTLDAWLTAFDEQYQKLMQRECL